MKKAYINPNKCDKSPFCAAKRSCPVKAISREGGMFSSEVYSVEKDKCIGCKKCIDFCPHNAISMK